MITKQPNTSIAIIGGGPSGIFMLKQLLQKRQPDFTIHIFEERAEPGTGMPYSSRGANNEHVTNVSGNEIPELVTPVAEWIATLPQETLHKFQLDKDRYHDYKVLPRLLFGQYLHAQFELLRQQAIEAGLQVQVHVDSRVTDICENDSNNKITVTVNLRDSFDFDYVVICTGHSWPLTYEQIVPGYFDSPYPPQKLTGLVNHTVAIRGSSLTAIDAIRTLARNNGRFVQEPSQPMTFRANEDAENFKIVMHSRQGLLPAVRFHLDDPHLSKTGLLTEEDIKAHMESNDGFLSLDFIFEKNFKDSFREKDPAFYSFIQKMSIEEFVDAMMGMRESADPFLFFKAEYEEARQSIRRRESVYWKEMLAVLSFAMNYPAKYLSAEDMLRLQKLLMPLISIVIAFVPQCSCEELIALHDAGRLSIISVDSDSEVIPVEDGGIVFHYTDENGCRQAVPYHTFIDCIGQRHLPLEALPFKSLVNNGSLQAACLPFRSAENGKALAEAGDKNIIQVNEEHYYLTVPGIAITDNFEVTNARGQANARLYMMAVPYIGGYNPDYSGLDFCEEASKRIVTNILQDQSILQPS